MVWLLKSRYEKHAEKLRGKLLRIVKVLDLSELKPLCFNLIGKVPQDGTKLFDSDYNLIKRFSHRIFREDLLVFFNHYHLLGKISDIKLAKYLIKSRLFDENDKDYVFIKKNDNISDDELILIKDNPRISFSSEIKEKILRLQKYRCAVPRCRFPQNSWRYLEYDHIKGRDDNSITNCQALCPFHHRSKTRMENIKKSMEKGSSNRRSYKSGRRRIGRGRGSHRS